VIGSRLYLDIAEVMRAWLELSGYPVIDVSRLSTGKLSFSQRRFLIDPSSADPVSPHASSRFVCVYFSNITLYFPFSSLSDVIGWVTGRVSGL